MDLEHLTIDVFQVRQYHWLSLIVSLLIVDSVYLEILYELGLRLELNHQSNFMTITLKGYVNLLFTLIDIRILLTYELLYEWLLCWLLWRINSPDINLKVLCSMFYNKSYLEHLQYFEQVWCVVKVKYQKWMKKLDMGVSTGTRWKVLFCIVENHASHQKVSEWTLQSLSTVCRGRSHAVWTPYHCRPHANRL